MNELKTEDSMSKSEKFLRHPLVVFLGMGVGVVVGLNFSAIAEMLKPVGDIYLLLVQMTVIPILISAIISSVGRFLQNPKIQKITSLTITNTIVALCAVIVISLVVGFILKPGIIPLEQTKTLAAYIGDQSSIIKVSLKDVSELTENKGFFETFVGLLVPKNIFSALSKGNTLSITFAAIIMGIAAGALQMRRSKIDEHSESMLIVFFEHVFALFQIILSKIIMLLPIGLVFIVSSQIAVFGFDIIKATTRLILSFHILALVIMVFNTIASKVVTRKPLSAILKTTLYPWLVGFTTKNSIAAIGPSLRMLHKHMDVDMPFAKLLTPLTLVIARFGNLAYFSIVSVFVSQLYGIQLSGFDIVLLAFGIFFAGFATIGASGFATLGAISIALSPVQLPAQSVLLILYAIDPIVDPIRTSLIVHTNITLLTIIHKKSKKKLENNEPAMANA